MLISLKNTHMERGRNLNLPLVDAGDCFTREAPIDSAIAAA